VANVTEQQKPAEKPASPAPPPKPKTFKEWALDWAKSIGIAVAIWLVLRTFLVEAFRIPSGSMERTLLVGDFLFVNKAVFGPKIPLVGWRLPAVREPRRNDLVVFNSVETRGLKVVKRVIGAPGDTLRSSGDTIFRNGQPLAEPYVQHTVPGMDYEPDTAAAVRLRQLPFYIGPAPERYMPTLQTWGPLVVPAGHYWVMGDNRDESRDSRYWGFLPRENIVGRPMFIYFSYDPRCFRPLPILTCIRLGRILDGID